MSGARQRSREQTEQFALYEDTEFLPDGKSQEADSKASAKSARRPPKMPEQNSRADDHAKTDSFGIYQVRLLLQHYASCIPWGGYTAYIWPHLPWKRAQ